MSKIEEILKTVKWPIIYSGTFAALSGIGNALGNTQNSLESKLASFEDGAIKSLPGVILINTLYARLVSGLMNTSHPKIYSNFLCTVVQGGMYFFLDYQDVENPLSAVLPGAVLGYTLTNIQNNDEG